MVAQCMLAIYVDYGGCRDPHMSSSSDSGVASRIQYAAMPNTLVFISINLILPNRTSADPGYTAKALSLFLYKKK